LVHASNLAKPLKKLNPKPQLLQLALWITVPVNATGAVIFSTPALRQLIGLPVPTHSFYGLLVGSWIGLFGLAYLRLALSKRDDRTFLAVGAFGKLSFFVLAVVYYFRSELGILALLASSLDAVFAGMFLVYLAKTA
jgi:hypothetical protein